MANFFGASDLDTLLSGFGVPVRFNVTGTNGTAVYLGKGIVDVADQDLYDSDAGQFAGKVMTVLVKTTAFPGLKEATSITVDGTVYGVIQIRQEAPDGAFTRVFLSR